MNDSHVSPQAENGHTDIANELMEALAKTRIPGEARQVLDYIIRKTYGWKKKSDAISLSQFVYGTGLKKTTVCRAITKLKEMNLIVTQKDNVIAITYSLNKYYGKWKPLPKKITLPKKIIGVTQKDNLPLPKKSTTKETYTKETYTKERSSLIEKGIMTGEEPIIISGMIQTEPVYQELIRKQIEVTEYLNTAANKNIPVELSRYAFNKNIIDLLALGYTVKALRDVINKKNQDPSFKQYMTPKTLFKLENFQEYQTQNPDDYEKPKKEDIPLSANVGRGIIDHSDFKKGGKLNP